MTSKSKSMTAIWMDSWCRQGKGGRGARQRAHSTFTQLENAARRGRWGIVTPENFTLRQARNFVRERLNAGIKVRSIESDMSAIRKALRGNGRHIDAKNWTRELVELPPASRKGTGVQMPDGVLQEALDKAPQHLRACIKLVEALGLRKNELIECRDSLSEWERTLRVGGASIELVAGAKGGRRRTIFLLPDRRADAYLAVVEMLAVTNNGKEYPIKDATNGRAAADKFSRELAKCGIKWKHSCHSLRRRFAVRQYRDYRNLGLDPRVALARLAMDLGHGEKRGRWVLNNYLASSLSADELKILPGRGRPRNKSVDCLSTGRDERKEGL